MKRTPQRDRFYFEPGEKAREQPGKALSHKKLACSIAAGQHAKALCERRHTI